MSLIIISARVHREICWLFVNMNIILTAKLLDSHPNSSKSCIPSLNPNKMLTFEDKLLVSGKLDDIILTSGLFIHQNLYAWCLQTSHVLDQECSYDLQQRLEYKQGLKRILIEENRRCLDTLNNSIRNDLTRARITNPASASPAC